MNDFLLSAKRTFSLETKALEYLNQNLTATFNNACEILLATQGRIIVTGMGKSGHIGRKIAATLASTGSPAFFVHPAEASHGDMGMITHNDTVLALSNSGTTSEIITLLPLIKRLGINLVSMTGAPNSTLAEAASVHLDVSVEEEACPLDLAPTSSTTAALVMGDALAIALLEAKGFTAEDFAFSHPGGALGRKLLLKASDIMHSGAAIPCVDHDTLLSDALFEITSKGLGMTTVSKAGKTIGVFTDGDLRRSIENNTDIQATTIGECMRDNFLSISGNVLAAEALALMEEKSITSLVVMENNCDLPEGIIHLHDILKAGVA